MKKIILVFICIAILASLFVGCSKTETTADTAADNTDTEDVAADEGDLTIAFCYQDLESPFWVASHKFIIDALTEKGVKVIEYNANEDANKQLEQVKNAITQGVDGIMMIVQDGESAVTICGVANDAGVPVAVFGRPPSNQDSKAIVAMSSEPSICTPATEFLVKQARAKYEETGEKITPLIIVGDLGDPNAVERRTAFYDVMGENMDIFNEIIEVPSEWDAATALANFTSAMQANPDVGLVFCSADFLLPQVTAVLEPLDKWKPIGDPNHVIMASADGDMLASELLETGYLDADAVHDLFGMAKGMLEELLKAIDEGNPTPEFWNHYPGFCVTQDNLAEEGQNMWGSQLRAEQ